MMVVHPSDTSVRRWLKRQFKKRRGAILKGKLRGTHMDTFLREYRLEVGGQRTFQRRMQQARQRYNRLSRGGCSGRMRPSHGESDHRQQMDTRYNFNRQTKGER